MEFPWGFVAASSAALKVPEIVTHCKVFQRSWRTQHEVMLTNFVNMYLFMPFTLSSAISIYIFTIDIPFHWITMTNFMFDKFEIDSLMFSICNLLYSYACNFSFTCLLLCFFLVINNNKKISKMFFWANLIVIMKHFSKNNLVLSARVWFCLVEWAWIIIWYVIGYLYVSFLHWHFLVCEWCVNGWLFW